MVEPKEIKPEQIIKEGTEEKIKKEKVVKEPAKNKESHFNYKKISVFLIIGLLLIIGIYYAFDKLQDSTSGEQQTETAKDGTKAEAAPSEGEDEGEGEEEGGEKGEDELPEGVEEELPEGEGEDELPEVEGEDELPEGEGEEEWSYEPGPNDYLFEKVGSEKMIESVRIRLNRVEDSTPKDFVVLEVGDVLREKLEVGETRIIEGLSITLLEAHPAETPLESYAKLRVEKP
ncbi:MAG: hypothetical protein KKA79_00570 [Nanoarchaeota archaeon]|nr:hypothetical protein [Nanoarchaeota archaeon]MCG2717666.1 hypothetical protein [Nanoarchaeota archaeon]